VKDLTAHADVWREFDEAAEYYERQRAGLGRRFRLAVEEAFDRIRRQPRRYPLLPGSDHRKCLVAKFPYKVVFVDRDDDVWVVAVAHHKRKPGYWAYRSQDD
jgi:toxin ParE1/3/4